MLRAMLYEAAQSMLYSKKLPWNTAQADAVLPGVAG